MPIRNPTKTIERLVTAIQDFHDGAGLKQAQINVSGGIDSSVMVGLLATALSPKNVIAAYVGINSSCSSRKRAQTVCEHFGVKLIDLDVTDTFHRLSGEITKAMQAAGYSVEDIHQRMTDDPTIMGGFRSCFRAPLARAFGRFSGNAIGHGTGNECEDRWLRFYQKGGDGERDTNPIGEFSKGEVYQLALALGLPRLALEAIPSPDLWGAGDAGHSDEEEIKGYLQLGPDYPINCYSYIDFETGQYKNVGLLERVSRFLDRSIGIQDQDEGRFYTATVGQLLFAAYEPNLDDLLCEAEKSGLFSDIPTGTVGFLLGRARRIERVTRHKANPMIPTLVSREALVAEGLLTNDLPVKELAGTQGGEG
jgi:NAD+ synthetase